MDELVYKGHTYYYYPEDIAVGEYTGQKNVYAQDSDGKEYNIVWNDDGTVDEINEIWR